MALLTHQEGIFRGIFTIQCCRYYMTFLQFSPYFCTIPYFVYFYIIIFFMLFYGQVYDFTTRPAFWNDPIFNDRNRILIVRYRRSFFKNDLSIISDGFIFPIIHYCRMTCRYFPHTDPHSFNLIHTFDKFHLFILSVISKYCKTSISLYRSYRSNVVQKETMRSILLLLLSLSPTFKSHLDKHNNL